MSTAIKKGTRFNRTEQRSGYLFALPILLHIVLFVLLPLFFSVYYSLNYYDNLTGIFTFCRLDNYKEALFGEYTLFWKALGNTFILTLGIPVRLFLGVVFAVLLNRKLRGRTIYRVLFYIPCVCSTVATSIMWKWIYNEQYGILNYVLSWVGIRGPNWLFEESTVLPAFIIMNVWGGLGTTIVYYLASLQNASQDVYDAAKADGAGSLRIFFRITIPMVSPVTFYLLIMGVINALQSFNQTYVMTGGGPNDASTTVVFLIWKKAFGGAGEMGYASAVAWLLAVIIFAITAIQFYGQKHWVNTND